jgi:hypothetical protein
MAISLRGRLQQAATRMGSRPEMILRRPRDSQQQVLPNTSSTEETSSETQQRRRRLTIRQVRCRILLIIGGVSVVTVLSFLQYKSLQLEQEGGPLDHVRSTIMKPFYNLQCPRLTGSNYRSTRHGTISSNNNNCTIPRLFIVNGRGNDRPRQAARSWERLGGAWNNKRMEIMSTSPMLEQMRHQEEENHSQSNPSSSSSSCRQVGKWATRLFRIYQLIFTNVLERFPEDHDFIFVEDDVVLRSPETFHAEICMAKALGVDFYSFYTTPEQGSRCTYEYGTPAFYASANFVKQLRDLQNDNSVVCRLPIDMYIASVGPWYASRSHSVQHIGTRFFPKAVVHNSQEKNRTISTVNLKTP